MITITVIRGAGDRPGEPVAEPMLSGSLAAATERGRNELDAGGSARERVAVEIDPQPGLTVACLIEVLEPGLPPWRGIVDSIALEITAGMDEQGRLTLTRRMSLEIEREEL